MTETVDARGLKCPLPVLKARKRLEAVQPGGELALIADDPAAVVDVPHFCHEAGHSLIGVEPFEGATRYLLRKRLT